MHGEIGSRLREARRASGVELTEVERRIKIRKGFLVAMEEERWEALPGEAYVRGFLRTYADCLGLDGDELVAEYRERTRGEAPAAGRAAGAEEAAATPSAAVEAVQSISTRSRPAALRRGGVLLRPRGRLLAALAALAAAAAVAALALAGGSEDGDRPAGGDAVPQAEGEQPAEEEEREEPAAPQRVTLELAATGDVWVCLVDQRDRPLIEGVILSAGEEQGPFRARVFALTVGNGQVELVADGETLPTADTPDPAGYRVTARGARELPPEERPTCG